MDELTDEEFELLVKFVKEVILNERTEKQGNDEG